MLYLSAYLKAHQQEYYDRLMQARISGNFDAWIRFFLEGIVSVSAQVLNTTQRIQQLERRDTDRLIVSPVGPSGVLLLRLLMLQPVVRVKDVERHLNVSYSKANTLVAEMEAIGLLEQITAGRRNRKFRYREYVDILSEGTELIPGQE